MPLPASSSLASQYGTHGDEAGTLLTSGLYAEVTCSHPPSRPHTRLQWDGGRGLGSVALYECVGGFYQHGGANMSTCLQSGVWTSVSVQCKGMLATRPYHNTYFVIEVVVVVVVVSCTVFVI